MVEAPIVSQAIIDRLKLRVHKHHHPNFVRWLKTSGEVLLQHTCQITFAISEDYKYTMWRDVVLMDCREKLSISFWSPF